MKYSISTDHSRIDLDYVHDFLCNQSFWAKGRSKELVQKSIENALCFSVLSMEDSQVGFARVITDYCTYAYLSDVFIDRDHRGKGLSKMLIQSILSYPDLNQINRWMLLTKDAHELYAKFDFRLTSKADWIMEKVVNDI